MTDLEQRIARLEAREKINNLLVDYSLAVDDCDLTRIGALFTVDGAFSHVDGTVVNEGREAVLAHYAARLGIMGATFHFPHSGRIDFIDDNNATGVVLAHAELGTDEGTNYVGVRYLDKYRCTEGVWQFAERLIVFVFFLPMIDFVNGAFNDVNRKRFPGQEPAPSDVVRAQVL